MLTFNNICLWLRLNNRKRRIVRFRTSKHRCRRHGDSPCQRNRCSPWGKGSHPRENGPLPHDRHRCTQTDRLEHVIPPKRSTELHTDTLTARPVFSGKGKATCEAYPSLRCFTALGCVPRRSSHIAEGPQRVSFKFLATSFHLPHSSWATSLPCSGFLRQLRAEKVRGQGKARNPRCVEPSRQLCDLIVSSYPSTIYLCGYGQCVL